jgi:hypothetical protein
MPGHKDVFDFTKDDDISISIDTQTANLAQLAAAIDAIALHDLDSHKCSRSFNSLSAIATRLYALAEIM